MYKRQAYKCGLKIIDCYIVYHGSNEKSPFEIEKVTDRVRQNYRYIDDNIWRLGKVKSSTEEVLEETGEHCELSLIHILPSEAISILKSQSERRSKKLIRIALLLDLS